MLRFNPPVYFLLSLVFCILLHFIWPVQTLIYSPLQWVGVLLIASGGWITVWADRVFKRMKTTVKPQGHPSTLVTNGPFSFSRHPMYCGMTAIALGLAMLLGSASSFLGPILFWIIMQFVFIPFEESKMIATFGETYRGYRERTRMWI